jgi:hypothetical protein
MAMAQKKNTAEETLFGPPGQEGLEGHTPMMQQ